MSPARIDTRARFSRTGDFEVLPASRRAQARPRRSIWRASRGGGHDLAVDLAVVELVFRTKHQG
jgi:hypothetical protein